MTLPAQATLLGIDRPARQAAIEALPADQVGAAVLRAVLFRDESAEVRALAAQRLGRIQDPRACRWLEEALGDEAPSVRDAVLNALARTGDLESLPVVVRATREEPVWWVRRTAVRLLASARADAVPFLLDVLDDPFWRVRAVAIEALRALGEAQPAIRAAVTEHASTDPAARAARAYLTATWSGAEPPTFAPGPDARPLVHDEDPAVVAATLLAGEASAFTTADLVPYLAESHAATREAAFAHLQERGSVDDLRVALAWLEQPLVPHAATLTRRLLDRLGAEAAPLVEEVLAGPQAGALAWVASWIARRRVRALYPRLIAAASTPWPRSTGIALLTALADLSRVHQDEAALSEALRAPLRAALKDGDRWVREAAIAGLVEAPGALAEVDPSQQTAPARRILAGVFEGEALRRLAHDDDPRAAARALVRLDAAGCLTPELRAEALADPDPLVRGAVIDADAALELLGGDPDLTVRRAAWRAIGRGWLHEVQAREGASPSPTEREVGGDAREGASPSPTECHVAAGAPDAWLRAAAARRLDPLGDDDLRLLLRLLHDVDPGVRAAALDPLDRVEPEVLFDRVAPLTRDPELARPAWTLLARTPERCEPLLRAALPPSDGPLRAHLEAIGVLHGWLPLPAAVPRAPAAPRVRPAPDVVEARALGRTGVRVAPLILSGVNDLPASAWREAVARGVDTVFWEPRYLAQTRFLRGRGDLQVVAGTYHAHAAGIRADVETALRRLRRDALDVFLLFWVRSPARLSAEAFEVLADLKRAGKIRSFGFSTHFRDLALAAVDERPWEVVMTRHNAAHVGAEQALFPGLAERGVGLLTFSALCYGRLLQRLPDAPPPPAAADLYRYSLSQPGVAATLSAPRRAGELLENLTVLQRPTLDATAQATLRAHGQRVYGRNRRFNRLVRQGRQPLPLDAAIFDLLAEAPPAPVEVDDA